MKSFKTDTDLLARKVQASRNSTIAAIAVHESANSQSVGATRRSCSGLDPWLTQCVLAKQIRMNCAAEEEYQANMLVTFRELEAFDEHICARMRDALVALVNANEAKSDATKVFWLCV
ncbi:hypothetical protein HDU84_005511 [Entophlyctis sp. JEL0112]|nr:hypothetical protein HDU84_005511 [Entophlyctis sp. JEL0112]